MELTIEQAIDLGYATLCAYAKESDRLEMTFAVTNCTPVNEVFTKDKVVKQGGKVVKGYITLKDTGNARHVALWEEDTSNVINTDAEITVNWTHFTNNLTYNRIELGMNMGNDVEVYDYLNGKRKNMYRESAGTLQEAFFGSPTSATDKKNPHGVASWLSQGTNGSTGGFTGYSGRYNDGSGTAYNLGGIASSASSNARWASYYADHDGNLGDNLLFLIDGAILSTNFIPPIIPEAVAKEHGISASNFRIFSTKNVILNLKSLLRKQDDLFAAQLEKLGSSVQLNGIPFVYVQQLDTASTYTYGTDPVIGVNTEYFHPVVLAANNFVIGKPHAVYHFNHNVLVAELDLTYAYVCTNRQLAGWLINQQ